MTAHELAKKLLEGLDLTVIMFNGNDGCDEIADVIKPAERSFHSAHGEHKRELAIELDV